MEDTRPVVVLTGFDQAQKARPFILLLRPCAQVAKGTEQSANGLALQAKLAALCKRVNLCVKELSKLPKDTGFDYCVAKRAGSTTYQVRTPVIGTSYLRESYLISSSLRRGSSGAPRFPGSAKTEEAYPHGCLDKRVRGCKYDCGLGRIPCTTFPRLANLYHADCSRCAAAACSPPALVWTYAICADLSAISACSGTRTAGTAN